MSFGLPKSVTISPLFSRDMIKHFLFLPLATPADTRIWIEKEGPRGQNLSRESRNIQQDRLTNVAINQVR